MSAADRLSIGTFRRAARHWSDTAAIVGESAGLTFATVFILLVLRRPTALTAPTFWADDGPIYRDAMVEGVASLLHPYAGYLIVGHRAAMLISTLGGPSVAPLLASLSTFTIVGLVVAFLASGRMSAVVPDPGRRAAAALALVVLPATAELLGTLSHIEWVIGAFVLAYAGASYGRRWELAVLAGACLTGPIVVIALPLYVARAALDRRTVDRLVVVAVAASLQVILAMWLGHQLPPGVPDIPGEAATPLAVAAALAEHVAAMALPAAILFLILIGVACRRLPAKLLLPIGWAALAIPLAGMIRSGLPAGPGDEPRYFWLSTWLLVTAVVAAPTGVTRTATLAVFALMSITRFAIAPLPELDWATASRCIGGPEPCVVAVPPTEPPWQGAWAVRWPGKEIDR